ncbi:MAG: cytochrome P460 [Bryobacterales bacterium]|nr:cytochrome P460 [Bryobacterales bacterium]
MAIRTAGIFFLGFAAIGAEPKMAVPRYAAGDQLIRPEGYREWIFVGSSIGMGYKDGDPPANAGFHHIYIQPEAYRQYVKTGTFPDKTMLVMEKVTAGTNASINKHGRFGAASEGIEASVKDERFPEKWRYYDFIGQGGPPLKQAKAFPKDRCWNCHFEHAATDNVFVQFYPVLKEARK